MRHLVPALLLCALALLCGAALADTLTFKDGTKLDGKVVAERPGEVVFEHKVGPALTRTTFKTKDLKSLEKSFGGEPAPEPGTEVRAGSSQPERAYAEVAEYKNRVLFVVDRSGSMAISDRFSAALDEVEKIVGALRKETKFDVIFFDVKATSLFEGDGLWPSDDVRKGLRAKMEAVKVSFEGRTDVVAGLTAALERRPNAVYLLTDGVPTAGEVKIGKLVDTVAALAARHKIPVHTVAVLGGKYLFGDCEDPVVAREILAEIAKATGGRAREVEAKPVRRRDDTALRRDPAAGAQPGFSLYHSGKRFNERELHYPLFGIEVSDPALVTGPFVLEYSVDLELELRSLTGAGLAFDSIRGLKLRYRDGTLWTLATVFVVRGNDQRARDMDASSVLLRAPTSGGMVEIVYRRGGQEYKHSVIIGTWPMKQ